MRGAVPAGALAGADTLVSDLGGDLQAIALDAGLPMAAFCDPELSVSLRAVVQFFAIAARDCGREDFGLLLSQRQDLTMLGPVYVLMTAAGTMADAIVVLQRYLQLHSGGLAVCVRPVAEGLLVEYHILDRETGNDRQAVELGLALLGNFIRGYRPDWRPAYVQFRHARPRSLETHRRFFGLAIAFDQERSALCIDHATLALRLHEAGRAERRVLARMIRTRDAFAHDAVPSRTEAAIRALLPYGADCSIEAVARFIGLSARTLQRRLALANLGFEAMRDQTRRELAAKYLAHSSMPIAEVVDALGFSQPAAFTRAFRRWYGVPPLRYRRGAR